MQPAKNAHTIVWTSFTARKAGVPCPETVVIVTFRQVQNTIAWPEVPRSQESADRKRENGLQPGTKAAQRIQVRLHLYCASHTRRFWRNDLARLRAHM